MFVGHCGQIAPIPGMLTDRSGADKNDSPPGVVWASLMIMAGPVLYYFLGVPELLVGLAEV